MEPICEQNLQQYMLIPTQRSDLMDMFKLQQDHLWTLEEIDFCNDDTSFKTLNKEEQHFIRTTLAWFANADNAVCENLMSRFMQEITIPEARGFYAVQAYIEFVHVQTYNMCIQAVVPDHNEQLEVMTAIKTNSIVKPKFDIVVKWTNSAASLGTRVAAFAFTEGVLFASSFASIYWLRKRGKLPGICTANELIIEDECLHVRFAALLYRKYIQEKLEPQVVYQMAQDFVKLEHNFAEEVCPVSLREINQELLKQYICRVADVVLELLGYDNLYNVSNPFDWMKNVGLMGKSNFFEKRETSYPNSVEFCSTDVFSDLGSLPL